MAFFKAGKYTRKWGWTFAIRYDALLKIKLYDLACNFRTSLVGDSLDWGVARLRSSGGGINTIACRVRA